MELYQGKSRSPLEIATEAAGSGLFMMVVNAQLSQAALAEIMPGGITNAMKQDAADFLRDNPEAPIAAVVTQLQLKRHYPAGTPTALQVMAWSVFASTFRLVFSHFEAERAAAEALAKDRELRGTMAHQRRQELGDQPFAATGFSAR